MANRSRTAAPSGVESEHTPASSRWGGFGDLTRERSAWLNQMLLGAVVLVATLVALVLGFDGDIGLFLVGVVAIFVVTAATLLIPWNRIALAWKVLIPLLDVVAILVILLAVPEPELALMLVFPAMWLSSTFGLIGLALGVASASLAYWVSIALTSVEGITIAIVLFPLVIAAVSTTSFLTARRTAAQRMLLDKQAGLLGRALERARRQEQSVVEVLDAVDFGVIRLGSDGRIVVTNDAHARLLSSTLDDEEALDAYRADGVTPLMPEQSPLTRARRGEAFDQQVVWFGAPNGMRQALTVTARRLSDVHGADIGAVVVSRDVTAELTALRARDDLVASVSHELRTPLTSILGYLDLAIDDQDVPESARKNLEIAERNTERLLGIVADILRASSTAQSSVDLTIRPQDIDLMHIVLASVEALQPRADEKSIVIDTTRIEPARAWADPLRVRQVVDNLLSNGIKYNREGGSVTVGCTSDGDSSWILVRDTGSGMAEDEMAGLFERFYRAASMRRSGIRGTGLGLSISRDIARAHGGEITVHSSPGVGSTFVVRLPAVRSAASPAPRMPGAAADDEAGADDSAADSAAAGTVGEASPDDIDAKGGDA